MNCDFDTAPEGDRYRHTCRRCGQSFVVRGEKFFRKCESDPTLIGNRIEALTKAVGIPTCGGCASRRDWLNKAHAWLRG